MNRTLAISFSLKNTYRVNSILYSLKQIPLLKKVIPATVYCSAPNNLDIRIIGGISIVKINPSTKAGNLCQVKSWLHHLSLVSGVRDQ